MLSALSSSFHIQVIHAIGTRSKMFLLSNIFLSAATANTETIMPENPQNISAT